MMAGHPRSQGTRSRFVPSSGTAAVHGQTPTDLPTHNAEQSSRSLTRNQAWRQEQRQRPKPRKQTSRTQPSSCRQSEILWDLRLSTGRIPHQRQSSHSTKNGGVSRPRTDWLHARERHTSIALGFILFGRIRKLQSPVNVVGYRVGKCEPRARIDARAYCCWKFRDRGRGGELSPDDERRVRTLSPY